MIRRWTAQAAERGAHLVAFPEMVLTGYPVEDLALRASFVDASRPRSRSSRADLAADGLGDLPVVVGYLDRATDAGTAGSDADGDVAAAELRRRSCTAAGSSPATPSTTCPTTASSTSTASSPRAPT